MDVQILSTQIIKPSMPTPHHLRTFKPSFLDQTSVPFYIPLTLFYNTKFDHTQIPQIHDQLKKSLSKTLKLYYPLAGKIHDMFTIICNDEGALYTEAKANFTLSEFLQKPDLNILNKLLPGKTNSLESGHDYQVSIQVSILACGGLVIGACIFHRIVDVTTMATFLKTWANFSSGHDHLKEMINRHDQDLAIGSSLFPQPSSLPDDYLTNQKNCYFSNGKNNSHTRRFVFSSSAIAELRAKAASQAVPNPSRIETLTGFISERLMAGFKSKSRKIIISQAVNIRKRLNPPLPEDAFGNFAWFVFFSLSDGAELADHVEMMREALDEINGESLSELEPESAMFALNKNLGMICGDDEIRVYKFTSWCNMGFYDLEFEWGLRPVWVGHMGDAGDGCPTKHQFLFLDGKNKGEIELWMLFGDEEMATLENDAEFNAYATPNPGIVL